jgi:hypothetical protein
MGSFSEVVMSFTLRPDLDNDVLRAFSGVPLVQSHGSRNPEMPDLPPPHEEHVDEYVFYEALEAGHLADGFEPWMYNWEWVLSGGHGTAYIAATTGGTIERTRRGWQVSFRSTLKSGSEELTYWFGWMGEFAIESHPPLLVGYFKHEYENRPWLVWHALSGPFTFENLNESGRPDRRDDDNSAQGSGEVLTGVVGPEPLTHHPHLATPLDGLTVADLPLSRYRESNDESGYIFTFDDPPIYVGTTPLGVHGALIGLKRGREVGVSLLTWTDRGFSGGGYYWPDSAHRRPESMRDHYHWSPTYGHPETWDIQWYPLPEDTAHVEFSVEGTLVASIRPTSRVALLHAVLSRDEIYHRLQGAAYDGAGQPLLVKPPMYRRFDDPRHGDA